jgi:EmrB/QacA subfamily drug resistance transporter
MRKWLPLLTVCLGTFMLLVDVTIVNVALPDMARQLHTSFGSLQWVVDAYALVLAALVLGTGSIADLVGHRRAYVAGLALFAAASFTCGIAPDTTTLVVSRAVQGLGGAAMFATTFALLNSSYSGRERATAYGLWGAVAGASAAIGPIAGGLLTQGISWRWIFFVNLPVSVVAMVLCVRVLTDNHERVHARVDVPGILTFSAAAGAAAYALIKANEDGWGSEPWILLAVAAVMVIAFVVVEMQTRQPMFDLALLRNRSFGGILLAATLLAFAAFSAFTYTSIWLQSVVGLTPIEAGLTGIPLSLAAFAVSAGMGGVIHRLAPGPLIAGGLLLIGVGGLVGAALVHGSATWPQLIPGFVLAGIGVGMATPTLSSAAMAAVPVQRGGMAAGAVNTGRQLGFAFGIAVLGSVFSSKAHDVLDGRGIAHGGAVANALAGGQARRLLAAAHGDHHLNSALHAAAVSGVQNSFLVAGLIGVAAAIAVFVLVRPSRSSVATPPEGAVPVPAAGAVSRSA